MRSKVPKCDRIVKTKKEKSLLKLFILIFACQSDRNLLLKSENQKNLKTKTQLMKNKINKINTKNIWCLYNCYNNCKLEEANLFFTFLEKNSKQININSELHLSLTCIWKANQSSTRNRFNIRPFHTKLFFRSLY